MTALPTALPRATEIGLDGRVLLFTCAVSLLTGVLAGLAPALKISQWRLAETLKEGGRGAGGGRQRAQGALVAVEVALAVVLFYSLVPRRRPLDNLALTAFGTAWVSLLGFAIIIGRSSRAIPLILLLVIVVAVFDIGQYFSGRAMGRHPMAPALSPKKTWEGYVGGTVLAIATGAFLSTVDYFPVSLNQSLVMIAIVVVLSPIGDAAESLIKRSLGVKDMGAVMPGHGGLLDRLDGLLFVVPAAYLFLLATGLL